MSVNTTEPPRQQTDWAEDEINLRQYVDVLIAWWKEILLIAIVFAAAAAFTVLGMRVLGAPQYEAAADVAILRTISEVTLDERFTTTSDNPAVSNAAARRNALVALAASPALAVSVIDQLGSVLTLEQRTPSGLTEAIAATLVAAGGRAGDSDLIRITATADTPEKAAQIATAWAQTFVREVNQVYGQVPDELLQSIQQEQAKAQADYQVAQAALEEFVAQNRVDELTRQIADRETVINLLQTSQQSTLDALIQETLAAQREVVSSYMDVQTQNIVTPFLAEQEGRRSLLLAYLDALYTNQTEVFRQQAERDIALLKGYYVRWLQITRSLEEIQTLRDQVLAAGESSSGSSALTAHLLKLQALTQVLDPQPAPEMQVTNHINSVVDSQTTASPHVVETSQPVQVLVGSTPLQIQLNADSTLTQEELLADIDSLVSALQARRTELDHQIETLSQQLLASDQYNYLGQTVSPESGLAQSIVAQSAENDIQGLLASLAVTASAPSLSPAPMVELMENEHIQELISSQGDGDLSETVTMLEGEVRGLKSALESEQAHQLQLSQQRDLTWEAYRTVSSKVAELSMARAATGSEVRFAAPGVAPANPMPGTSLSLSVALAGVVGLLVGVCVAFTAHYLGKEPFLSRRGRSASVLA